MFNGRGAVNPQVISSAAGLFQKAQREADAPNIVRLGTADQDGIAGKYPIQLGSADPDDIRVALRQQVVNPQGEVPGMGIAVAGDREFDYLQRKKEEVFYAQFLAYINAQANLSEPASAAWWFERFPFLKEKRLEEINREAEKQKRLAQIQVTGPQNEDDFFLLYMIQQGLISRPSKPLTTMWEDPRYDTNRTNFTKGMFSPLSTAPQSNVQGGVGLPANIRFVPAWNNPLNLGVNGGFVDGRRVNDNQMPGFQRPGTAPNTLLPLTYQNIRPIS